jgi:hypothetical protein
VDRRITLIGRALRDAMGFNPPFYALIRIEMDGHSAIATGIA